MRNTLFALVALGTVGAFLASPGEAQAQRWRWGRYYSYPAYSSYYYAPYAYDMSFYSYPTTSFHYSPASAYTYSYPTTSYYYTPSVYSSYYYSPVMPAASYYYTPSYYSAPGRYWRWWR